MSRSSNQTETLTKRQTRILSTHIVAKLKDISGKRVNIVLKSGGVIFAEITGLKDNILEVRNMRLKKSTVDIRQVSEIISDIVV